MPSRPACRARAKSAWGDFGHAEASVEDPQDRPVVGIVVLVAFVGVGAYWAHHQMQRLDVTAARARWPKAMTFEDADRAARDLVSKMTLDEKVDQMTGSGMAPMLLGMLLRGEMAPVYAGANGASVSPRRLHRRPPRRDLRPGDLLPGRDARAATWDVDLQRRVGDAIGQEARAQGANYWGGLCLNIVRHPSMGRAQETYGEDPWLTGEMGVAILEAVQRHNVMACAKHFALNSMETARFKNDVEIDERTLREVYMPQFRKAVEHDVATFMSAYNKVRGEWCGENRHLLTTILRDDWGFRGYVTSDWACGASTTASEGMHAGLDIEMPAGQFYGKNLKALVERGDVPLTEVDESVRRIVRTKLLYLTREDPQTYPPTLAASAEHVALAREVAEKAVVLLKNEPRCSRWTRLGSGRSPSWGTLPTPTTRVTTAAATSRPRTTRLRSKGCGTTSDLQRPCSTRMGRTSAKSAVSPRRPTLSSSSPARAGTRSGST